MWTYAQKPFLKVHKEVIKRGVSLVKETKDMLERSFYFLLPFAIKKRRKNTCMLLLSKNINGGREVDIRFRIQMHFTMSVSFQMDLFGIILKC